MGFSTSRGGLAESEACRRAIKMAEEIKSFDSDHLEFTRRIGFPQQVARTLFRRLQDEGEPTLTGFKYDRPPFVKDLLCRWKQPPMNWG